MLMAGEHIWESINAEQTRCILRKTRFTSFLLGERVSHAKLTHVKRISYAEQMCSLIRENVLHTRSKCILLVACKRFTPTAHAFLFSCKRAHVWHALYLASDGYCTQPPPLSLQSRESRVDQNPGDLTSLRNESQGGFSVNSVWWLSVDPWSSFSLIDIKGNCYPKKWQLCIRCWVLI